MLRRIASCLLVLFAITTPAPASAADDPTQRLLEDVRRIWHAGVPGPLALTSPDAVAIVVGGSDRQAVVAATRLGAGRVVAFGHGGYFGKAALAREDTAKLMLNAARWISGGPDARIGVVDAPEVAARLEDAGYQVLRLTKRTLPKALTSTRAMVVDASAVRGAQLRELVRRYVKSGRGLITANLGWGWKQLNPGKDLATEHPGNLLLAGSGVMWADGYLSTTSGYAADGKHLRLANASTALDFLLEHAHGAARGSKAELAQASAVVLSAARSVAASDPFRAKRLAALLAKARGTIVPSATRPLTANRALDRVLLGMEVAELSTLPAGEVRAHPAAAAFPGAVPPDAPTVVRSRVIDTSRPGHPREGIYAAAGKPTWHSTGVYARPGKAVRVSVPRDALGKGLGVRIGAHTDHIWQKPGWSRVPQISRWFPIEGERTAAANAFGGLVYVTVPKAVRIGEITIRVAGGVAVPHFVLGETSIEDWQRTIRSAPAPWAELETAKVVLTLPASRVRALDDPTAALKVWDKIQDACADLSARPRDRQAPERVCADVQISNGYMHSGYPFMTHLDAGAWMADAAELLKGSWGLFHEMGHNHQSRHWTFKGTTEVTVNLFSLYILDKVCGIPPARGRKNVPVRGTKLTEYLASGPDFSRWKKDPWLALTTYWHLQQAFGWQPFLDVFREYREVPPDELPTTDADKRDQFMLRMSRRVERNLGPYFQAWGIPTTQAAREEIRGLPVWMPEGFPPR